MTHLTDEQLREWQTDGRDGDHVVAHLAECDECGARLAAGIRDASLGDAPLPEAGAYLQRGYAAFRSKRRVPWRAISIALGTAAAAAIWIFAEPAWFAGSHVEPLRRPPQVVARGTAIRVLGPIDSARLPLTFSWSSPVQPASYRVDIVDGTTPVLSTAASGSTLTLAAETASRLQPDRPYRWRVVALAADGSVLAESDWAPFRLTR